MSHHPNRAKLLQALAAEAANTSHLDKHIGRPAITTTEVVGSAPANQAEEPTSGYVPLKCQEYQYRGDLQILVHRDLLKWIVQNVKLTAVRNELLLAYWQFLRSGTFSINTKRFQYAWGGSVRNALKKALEDCPYVVLVRNAIPKKRSRTYRFKLRSLAWSPESTYPYGLSCHPLPGYSRTVHICQAWLERRRQRWTEFCEEFEYEILLDLHGHSEIGQATFDALSHVSVPLSDDFASDLPNTPTRHKGMSKREWALWYRIKCISGELPKSVMRRSGRTFHPLTNCPKSLRKVLLMEGQPMAEADLGCSHPYLLATQLPPGEERDHLIQVIQDGTFYDMIGGSTYPDRSKLKVEMMRQCLFWRDPRRASRPLWQTLKNLFPGLCRLICHKRKQLGISGFARFLMRIEGALMDRVQLHLSKLGVPALRLHDAMLCAADKVQQVADVMRQLGKEILGLEPLVTIK